MMTPTIHINGTSAKNLYEDLEAASNALKVADHV